MNILHNGAITLHHGDCLDVMHEIPDGSVDAIICDPPYGKTSCAWDVVIPFEPMWAALKRIIKPRGAIVLFGSQPFTSALIMSNVGMFKYEWVWEKNKHSNFLQAKRQPLRAHEDVLVFSSDTPVYNFQPRKLTSTGAARNNRQKLSGHRDRDCIYGDPARIKQMTYTGKHEGYPRSVIRFNLESNNQFAQPVIHPTQKPVALLEYLIRTYTNEGETVLDFTFGSCTAGVAALTTKRRFIGIERDDTYYALGVQRVQTAIDNLPPMDV